MKIHSYYVDNVIIQADKPFTIKGTTLPNGKVSAVFKGYDDVYAYAVSDNDGKFKLSFPKIKASFDSYTLTVSCDTDSITINNVLFGDVYYMTGQSNMAYTLKYLEDNVALFNKYSSPYIRLHKIPYTILKSSDRGWVGSPIEFDDYTTSATWDLTDDFETIKERTGFGYVFAGAMFRKTKRPIGIVDASIGGSSVENWYPRAYQLSNDALKEYDSRAEIIDGLSRVGSIYTECVAPLFDIKIKGMVWYQGESNCYNDFDGLNYAKMAGDTFDIIRKGFKEDFPIALVHLSVFNITTFGVNYVNEQLDELALTKKDMVSVPVYDLPARWKQYDGKRDYHPIHPTTKTANALRTADAFYQKFIKKEGYVFPYIEQIDADGEFLNVTVKTNKPLKTSDGKDVFGFTICGEDKKYYVAKAKITSATTVKVYSPDVKEPKGLCYAFFTYNNDCNLFGGNLPVMPYRTDKLTNVLDNKYFAIPHPVYTCNRKNAWVSCTMPMLGNTGYEPTWTTAKLGFSDSSSVKVTDDGVELSYTPDIKNMYYIGVSPNLNLVSVDNGLHAYRYLNVTIFSDKDVDFAGFTFQLANNKRYNYPPLDKTLPKGETKTFKIDLQATAINLANAQLFSDDRKNIVTGQFTFLPSTFESGKIIIKEITLSDN